MLKTEAIVRRVHGLLEYEPRINLHRYPIRITVADGAVVLEGEVENIAAKKLALELAAGVEGVRGVVDRLRIVPGERKGDGAIRDSLSGFLLREPELRTCAIRVRAKGRIQTLREVSAEGAGEIEVAIDDGVITLEGTVISLSHKRIAGVQGAREERAARPGRRSRRGRGAHARLHRRGSRQPGQ
jgi:osmotically-inducible protein OsmY